MDKKEFTETKTVISPNGKTVTTVTVSGSSEVARGLRIFKYSVPKIKGGFYESNQESFVRCICSCAFVDVLANGVTSTRLM